MTNVYAPPPPQAKLLTDMAMVSSGQPLPPGAVMALTLDVRNKAAPDTRKQTFSQTSQFQFQNCLNHKNTSKIDQV